ncbi:CO or xanthine dehydrogenase, FAD-binding subunit [Jannaschia seohaensis]|uniref:CO or xanthine dehydrogenase, FAD-binding subunit n=2 Tax=Jannaschia seohaensis TaxID=475081 RepID=A0A2Y9AGX6_9RHOB|nr:CO/xanthine dehydrogenase FAD-binding subunit [Jannaschia seohaensis]SSA41617.1 CO or xanthine dehydrogenase, FAD-binding subunit [Jannaschia seohaensis]
MDAAYYAPTDLEEALGLLGTREISVVAGGTDWFPARGRTPVSGDVLDVTRLAELRGIDRDGAGWRIGAATTWTQIARADLPPVFGGLRAAAREVGGVQIQNAGTVAGNLCNASPAADGMPPFLTLDAEVELAGPAGRRRLPLADFVTGPRQTARGTQELVVALHIPAQPAHARGAFVKTGARRYLVISIAMTAVTVGLDAEGRIDHARVAVGACAPVARRLPALEAEMLGRRPADVTVTQAHLAPLAPIDDVRADAAYRAEIVPHQISRALTVACDG